MRLKPPYSCSGKIPCLLRYSIIFSGFLPFSSGFITISGLAGLWYSLSTPAGVDSEYHKPASPDIVMKPEENGKNPEKIIEYLNKQGIFPLHE